VLLREVEYFKGILIMTTNRVRAFDPAIMSRIHHAVDFEGTTQQQEYDLWMLWLKRVQREGAYRHGELDKIKKFINDTNKKKKRNYMSGREIRNVFLTAQILAEDPKKGIKIGEAELERAHDYKANFLADTEGKINEAKAMVMSGMKQ
jgi:AAA+ superfamily predicted ATPase